MPKKLTTPAYTRHSSGQARVRIDGKAHYLGPFGSPESREKYDELVSAWLAKQDTSRVTLTIDDLSLLYLSHAESYYRKDGQPTSEVTCIRAALRFLIAFAGRTRARQFGPRQFREFRDSLVNHVDGRARHERRTLSRQYINKVIRKIVGMFKWAAQEELVPVSVWHGLTTVGGLKKGRCQAREVQRVRPVDDASVEAVLPLLTPPVRAMVELQRLTGMRPGEVVELRPCDVTRRIDGVWTYRPPRFKTEHHDGMERVVFLGPKAQEILRPWLDRDPDQPCFSPREAVAWLTEQKRAQRKSKVQPSQRDRRRPGAQQPAEKYTEEIYRRSIQYACRKAEPAVPVWAPNQIRHSVGTVVRERFGLEAAQVTLGHRKADVTQVYAERDLAKAAEIMRQIG